MHDLQSWHPGCAPHRPQCPRRRANLATSSLMWHPSTILSSALEREGTPAPDVRRSSSPGFRLLRTREETIVPAEYRVPSHFGYFCSSDQRISAGRPSSPVGRNRTIRDGGELVATSSLSWPHERSERIPVNVKAFYTRMLVYKEKRPCRLTSTKPTSTLVLPLYFQQGDASLPSIHRIEVSIPPCRLQPPLSRVLR